MFRRTAGPLVSPMCWRIRLTNRAFKTPPWFDEIALCDF